MKNLRSQWVHQSIIVVYVEKYSKSVNNLTRKFFKECKTCKDYCHIYLVWQRRMLPTRDWRNLLTIEEWDNTNIDFECSTYIYNHDGEDEETEIDDSINDDQESKTSEQEPPNTYCGFCGK